jgi:hypothetical protein
MAARLRIKMSGEARLSERRGARAGELASTPISAARVVSYKSVGVSAERTLFQVARRPLNHRCPEHSNGLPQASGAAESFVAASSGLTSFGFQ